MCRFERWTFGDGKRRVVAILRRQPCGDDACPECGHAIAAAVAKTPGLGRVFRLEGLFCPWTTDALPDPEREEEPFKRSHT
ncbi:MAG: hypothetical protein LBT97_02370 [Planctomycetota bacterium]|jgi:hypothetical protein|nr:hypothetical protein [Planctomycetota bacterium]